MRRSVFLTVIIGFMLICFFLGGCSTTQEKEVKEEKKVYPGAVGPTTSNEKEDKKEDKKEDEKVYSGAVGPDK
ncbi:MAG: hypothetical protein CMI55_04735 [Parcubacteria group bacterium]|jgi:hypothetical protein|nr:hypothetical protein [Parcubacteria group bacterium]|tara:strand:+ start:5131 stop:5349 length:219 start_codon:yes stop_codon:yes gene_type:complete